MAETTDAIDLSRWLRPGDTVWWNQCTAEPLTLTEALVSQRQTIGRISVFIGPTYTPTLQPEHRDYFDMLSYCGIGENRRLIAAGALEVIPSHCSQMHGLIQEGTIPIDVVFLHLSPEGPNGQRSLGIANDYLIAAAKRARVVIAEVNQQMPWTYTTEALEGLRIDAFVHSDRPLVELHPGRVQEVEAKIAEHASAFIHDRSVLEMGVGAIPEAILQSLKDRRDLGIHTGMLGDVGADLMQCGAVTNAFKNIDRGLTTAGVLMGTQRLYAYAHENRQLNLRPYSHTHAVSVIAQLDNFVAVNSAVEVDLTGQVNAEIVNGQYVGATGGQVDFTRGAQLAKNGRSIVALPSATKNAQQSRIVARIASGSVTTLRTDADVIVTEWGAAQLKGQTLKERMRRMIAISHPDHRESLERHAHEVQN